MQIYWFKTRVKKMRLSALGGITNLVSFCFGPEERKRYGIAYKLGLARFNITTAMIETNHRIYFSATAMAETFSSK